MIRAECQVNRVQRHVFPTAIRPDAPMLGASIRHWLPILAFCAAATMNATQANAQGRQVESPAEGNAPLHGGAIILPPKTIDAPSASPHPRNAETGRKNGEGDASSGQSTPSVNEPGDGKTEKSGREAGRPGASSPGFGTGTGSSGTSCKGPKELCKQNSAR